MPGKKPPPTFAHPRADLDLAIISRERFRDLTKATLGKWFKEKKQPRFYCRRRCYLLQSGELLLMFYPELVDIRRCVLTIRDREPPFEVWTLDDDLVVDYFELGGG